MINEVVLEGIVVREPWKFMDDLFFRLVIYRDSKSFWYSRHSRVISEFLLTQKTSLESVRYAAGRIDEKITFNDAACERFLNVPRIFLPNALRGCVDWARENGVELITEEQMDIINDKRAKKINNRKKSIVIHS